MANVVIVVDMLRGFLEQGYPLYCGPNARKVISCVHKLLRRDKRKGSKVIFLADTHDPEGKEFQMFPVHCVRGTPESKVIPELASFDPEAHAFALKHMEKILGARTVWSGLTWSEDKPGADDAVSLNKGAEVTEAALRHPCWLAVGDASLRLLR